MKRFGILTTITLMLTVVSVGYSHPAEKNQIHKFENRKAVIAPYIANEPAMAFKAFEFEVPTIQGVTSLGVSYWPIDVRALLPKEGFEFGTWKVKPPATVGSSSE